MKRLLILLTLLAPQLRAQEVPIRSGDHENFARLVLTIPAQTDWQIEQVPGAAILSLGDGQANFDTSEVFDRIQRDRLSGLEDLGDGRLRLSLACDPCHVDGFLWQADRLVIDVVDGPDPDAPEPGASAAEPILPLFAAAPDPLPLPFRRDVQNVESTASAPSPDTGAPGLAPAFPPDAPVEDRSAFALSEVTEQLSRAVAQGLLDAAGGEIVAPDTMALSAAEAEMAEPLERSPTLPVVPEATGPGIVMGTAVDSALGAVAAQLASDAGQRCLPEDVLSPLTWIEGGGFIADMATAEKALLNGDGDLRPTGAVDLARSYLAYGLTQEARALLDLAEQNSTEIIWAVHLSDLIDGLVQESQPLVSQLGCSNRAEMWLLLTEEPLSRDQIELAARSFRLLPENLQGMLAARAANRMIDLGEVEQARVVLETAASLRDAARRSEFGLVEARLLELTGEPLEAAALLHTVTAEDPRAPLAEILPLLEDRLVNGLFSEADLALVFARQPEATTAEAESALLRLEILGRFELGRFEEAIERLDWLVGDERADLARAIAADGLGPALASLGDEAFLSFAYSPRRVFLTAEHENAIAVRLLQLGFAERVGEFLDGGATRAALAERRFLRAEVALEMGTPERALDHIAGLRTPRADALRARAFEQLGDAALAFQAAERAGIATPGDALRASAWDRLALDPQTPLAPLAALRLSEEGTTDTSLAARRDLLEASAETRAVIEGLLTGQ